MKINIFLGTLILSGVSTGYKLRRDLGKIRYYCEQLCTECGGEASLNLDMCVCNPQEAEPSAVNSCLQKMRNKFDFLGIKWEISQDVNKIHTSRDQPYKARDKETVRGAAKISGLKLSESLSDSITKQSKQGTTSGPLEFESSTEESHRKRRSLLKFQQNPELTKFAANMFQPMSRHPSRQEANFKLLLGGLSESQLNKNVYYNFFNNQVKNEKEVSFEAVDPSDSEEYNDYSDNSSNLGDFTDFVRYTNDPDKEKTASSSSNDKFIVQQNTKDMTSIWRPVFPEICNQKFYYPNLYYNLEQ